MARTISKRLICCLVTGLAGSVLFWCTAAWSQSSPTLTEALAQARESKLPEPVIIQALTKALEADFDRSEAARTLFVLAEAQRMDFDLAPFQDRIAEGIAKRIESVRIAAALEERLQRQILVSERLKQGRDDEDTAYQTAVASLADGLEMGLTPQELDTLLQRGGDAPLAMTVVAAEMWALMKQLTVAPSLTEQIIFEGLALRALAPAWRHFPQVLVIARQKGVSDEDAVAQALESLKTGGAPSDLLTGLGFTGRDLKTGPMTND